MLFWTLFLTGVTYFGSEMILLLQNGTDRSENNIQIIQQASLWMAFTGKFFISGSFSVIYTYTAELFPTTVRTIGLGIGSLGGGLGGVIAPYVLALQVSSFVALAIIKCFLFRAHPSPSNGYQQQYSVHLVF